MAALGTPIIILLLLILSFGVILYSLIIRARIMGNSGGSLLLRALPLKISPNESAIEPYYATDFTLSLVWFKVGNGEQAVYEYGEVSIGPLWAKTDKRLAELTASPVITSSWREVCERDKYHRYNGCALDNGAL